MEMELEAGPGAAGTESTDLCATVSARAYPSSSNHNPLFLMLVISSNWPRAITFPAKS